MITVVSIQNPMLPEENIKDLFDYKEGALLEHYLQHIDLESENFIIAVNGIIGDTAEIIDGDIISVSVKIEASFVAGIVAVFGATGGWAAATGFVASALFIGGYVVTNLVIGYGLSLLAGALGPDVGPDAGPVSEPTYGWEDLRQTTSEGTPIYQIFGKNKVAGTLLNYFTTITDDDQRLNLLMGVCGHELQEITDIQLNGRDTDNFREIMSEVTLGRSTDVALQGFGDIVTTTNINTKLVFESEPLLEVQTKGDQVERLTVVITAPGGMYRINDDGDLVTISAEIKIEYKLTSEPTIWTDYNSKVAVPWEPNRSYPVGTVVQPATDLRQFIVQSGSNTGPVEPDWDAYLSNFNWSMLVVEENVNSPINWFPDFNYSKIEISGAQNTAIRKEYVIDVPAGEYDVRVTLLAEESTTTRRKDTLYFTLLQESLIDENLQYPGVAKYAVRLLATDQLSGSIPTCTCLANRSVVPVWDEDYSIPSYRNKRATNPAWIVWYLLHQEANVDIDRLIWSEFKAWADYCDDLIEGEPRIEINKVISTGNFWQQAQETARLGRATIVRRGVRYGVFVDMEDNIVSHLFSMGNIIDKSLKITYLPIADLANAVEVEYNDSERDYARNVVTIYSPDYLSNEQAPQKANISLQASMPQAVAVREGIYRINSNKLLKRTITFDAFIDSFACTVGDIFLFQHITPNYDDKFGGRIIEAGNDNGSGQPYVVFDQELTIGAGEVYAFTVRLKDDTLVEKIITSAPTTSDTFVITTSWSTVPDTTQFPPYILGISTTYEKEYRLVRIDRKDDFTRTITGVEYISEIYSDDDDFVISEITVDEEITTANNVLLEEDLVFDKGDFRPRLNVSWSPPWTTLPNKDTRPVTTWAVWIQNLTDGTTPHEVGRTQGFNAVIGYDLIQEGKEYRVYINDANTGEGAIGL